MINKITLNEAAAQLGKSSETVRRWAISGSMEIRYTYAATGNSFMVSSDDIDAIVAKRPDNDKWMNTKEAANVLGCHRNAVPKMCKRKEIGMVKWCNNIYVSKDDVYAMKAAGYNARESQDENRRANGSKPKTAVVNPNAPINPMLQRVDEIRSNARERVTA